MSFLPVRLNRKQTITGLLAIITMYGSFSVITEYRTLMHTKQQAGLDVFDFSVQAESFQSDLLPAYRFFEATEDRLTSVENTIFSSVLVMGYSGSKI